MEIEQSYPPVKSCMDKARCRKRTKGQKDKDRWETTGAKKNRIRQSKGMKKAQGR